MQPEVELNAIQASIMRQLFLNGDMRFARLNTDAIPSDHFSYHLRQLLKMKLIEKSEALYRLTTLGKTQAIRLAEDKPAYIRQALVALRMVLTKHEAGEEYFLVQERTKVPFRGVLALPGGKVLFGEDICEAAARMLQYETGLTGTFRVSGLMHYKDVYEGAVVQDKFFFVVRVAGVSGALKPVGPTGKNYWHTRTALRSAPNVHDGLLAMVEAALQPDFDFQEKTFVTETY